MPIVIFGSSLIERKTGNQLLVFLWVVVACNPQSAGSANPEGERVA